MNEYEKCMKQPYGEEITRTNSRSRVKMIVEVIRNPQDLLSRLDRYFLKTFREGKIIVFCRRDEMEERYSIGCHRTSETISLRV